MSTKALTKKIDSMTRDYQRKRGDNAPEFTIYWGMNAEDTEALRNALCQIPLSEDEQTRFLDHWHQIADKLAWTDDFSRVSLYALTDQELDELEAWVNLLEERGATLAQKFETTDKGTGYTVTWGIGLTCEA